MSGEFICAEGNSRRTPLQRNNGPIGRTPRRSQWMDRGGLEGRSRRNHEPYISVREDDIRGGMKTTQASRGWLATKEGGVVIKLAGLSGCG